MYHMAMGSVTSFAAGFATIRNKQIQESATARDSACDETLSLILN